MLKSLKQYFTFAAILGFIIFMIGFVIYYNSLPPYVLNNFAEMAKPNYPYYERVYVDLKNSDETNRISISNRKDALLIEGVIIDSYSGPIEEHYNLNNIKKTSPVDFFEDIDGDDSKEILFLHTENDTIFLTGINHKKGIKSPNRLPLLSKPEIIGDKEWDKYSRIVGFHQSDKEKRFLYFNVNAGYSLYPRDLFLYDMVEKKIVKSFSTGSHFFANFKDINDDGIDEILLFSYASNNIGKTQINIPFADTTAWLIAVDKDLNLLWAYSKGKGYVSFTASVLKSSSTRILTLFTESSNNFKGDSLYLFSPDGKVIKKREYSYQNGILLKEFDKYGEYGYYICSEFISLINEELEEVKKIYMKLPSYFPKVITDGNNKKYLFLSNSQKIFLFDNELNLIAEKEQHNIGGQFFDNSVSFKYSKSKGESFLVVNTEKSIINLAFEKRNFLLYFFYAFSLYLITILIFFILLKSFLRLKIYLLTISQTISKASGAILVVNDRMKILSYNLSAENLFESTLKKGKYFSEEINNATKIISLIQKSKIISREINEEINLSSAGKKVNISASVVPLKFVTIIAFLIKLEDRTEIIQRERSRVWFHSMQKIAHEIKTPLSSMLINLRSIEKNNDKFETDKELIDKNILIIKNEIVRIKNLTNNLLKFADIQKLNFKPVDIFSIIEKVKVKFYSFFEDGTELIINSPEIEIFVMADAYQIEEVLQVLIENGIDAVDGRGSITVELKKITKDNLLKISIIDNGNGIKPEDIDKIYDPYFTTKTEGTGMGLAIAHKIVKDHNSSLIVKSELNNGTSFSFNLSLIEKNK